MSTIKVDKITGRTGAASTAPLQFNGDSIIFTPGSAPGSPTAGQIYYDSTADVIKFYNGTSWKGLVDLGATTTAIGGTITTDGSDTIHIFRSSGVFIPSSTLSVEYLIVAGGGAGGSSQSGSGSGGGGAGGYRTGTSFIAVTIYTITVGAGGSPEPGIASEISGNPGFNSSISGSGLTTLTAIGGGEGGSSYGAPAGGSGGSGGSIVAASNERSGAIISLPNSSLIIWLRRTWDSSRPNQEPILASHESS